MQLMYHIHPNFKIFIVPRRNNNNYIIVETLN